MAEKLNYEQIERKASKIFYINNIRYAYLKYINRTEIWKEADDGYFYLHKVVKEANNKIYK